MVRRLASFWAVICVAVLFTACAPAARADCAMALTDFEAGVCDAQNFNMADEQLNQTYMQLYNILPFAQQTDLRHGEQVWVDQRNQACTLSRPTGIYVDFGCATRMTQARISALRAQLAMPIPQNGTNGIYTVPGTAMPWQWTAGGLNSAYPFGLQNGTPPTVVKLTSLKAKPGQSLLLSSVSGQVCVGGVFPCADASGTPLPPGDQYIGVMGRPLPSTYMHPHPINLGTLVAAFTGSQGQLVAPPFVVGNGPASVVIPPRAIFLQLGVNDDLYTDNSGSFSLSVKLASGDSASHK